MTQTNNGSFKRKLLATAILAPMMAIVGCSDNDGSTTPPPAEEEPTGVASGFAYDGYLSSARVCVDVNLNKACDAGEPATLTDAQGEFEITGLTDAQRNLPLVLESTEATIDLDTNEPVGLGLKFLAPGGSTAISGFSTVIQAMVENAVASGATGTLAELRDQAAATLATDLGLDGINLVTFDPIATKNDTTLDNNVRRNAAQLHLANQVLSEQILALVPQVDGSTAAFGALVNELDVHNVYDATVASTPESTISLNDLLSAPTTTVVGVTEPTAPTAEEIAVQAAQDALVQDAIQQAAETEEPTEPTGATGTTGGTGTA